VSKAAERSKSTRAVTFWSFGLWLGLVLVRLGLVLVRLGLVRLGLVRLGLVLVRLGLVRLGLVLVRLGLVPVIQLPCAVRHSPCSVNGSAHTISSLLLAKPLTAILKL
jgi:hypothetical protein